MEIYVEYGFSKETTVNVVKPGKSGAEEIKAMMDNFRANPPKEIGGSAVSLIKDYKTLELTDARQRKQAGYARDFQCTSIFHCRRHEDFCPSFRYGTED